MAAVRPNVKPECWDGQPPPPVIASWAMKRIALTMLLVGCGGGIWPDGEWIEGRAGEGFVGTASLPDKVAFDSGHYERTAAGLGSYGCRDSGTFVLVPSVDDWGDPATDVVLTPTKGSCGASRFLRKGEEIWLRPVPPATLFTAFRRD